MYTDSTRQMMSDSNSTLRFNKDQTALRAYMIPSGVDGPDDLNYPVPLRTNLLYDEEQKAYNCVKQYLRIKQKKTSKVSGKLYARNFLMKRKRRNHRKSRRGKLLKSYLKAVKKLNGKTFTTLIPRYSHTKSKQLQQLKSNLEKWELRLANMGEAYPCSGEHDQVKDEIEEAQFELQYFINCERRRNDRHWHKVEHHIRIEMYSRESPKFYIDRKAWHTFGIDNVLRTKTYAPVVKTTWGRNYYYEKPTAACSTHRIVFAPTLKEAMKQHVIISNNYKRVYKVFKLICIRYRIPEDIVQNIDDWLVSDARLITTYHYDRHEMSSGKF